MCQCEPSYIWDTSRIAFKSKNVCVCPPNHKELTLTDPSTGLRIKRCVPNGKCQTVADCPYPNTSVCVPPNPTDIFADYGLGLCQCAPGYYLGGFESACTPLP
jgi:hypothetical protein